MSYIQEVIDGLVSKYPEEVEFHQAVKEVFLSIAPIIEKNEEKFRRDALLERLVTPERVIIFSVPWVDDMGNAHVNTGYRVQFNSAIGLYKGGIRFHPSVRLGTVKFLGFEQSFKNALTGLPIGGGKGGSDFDPKGKSERELMAFCQSFMNELYRHIGANVDVPAGDIGVSSREIGYLFGRYKKLTGLYEGVLTGKDVSFGGSLIRKETTGYGLLYITEALLRDNKDTLKDKVVTVSGSGNVAIYAIEKAIELGVKVVTCSDSTGWIYDEEGIDIDVLKYIKEGMRGRLYSYLHYRPKAIYHEEGKPWSIKCDIALPCATQNEVDIEDAKNLVKNGCKIFAEGANMPANLDATNYLLDKGVFFLPAKAANAGGVATSAMEMSQNSMRISWEGEEVDLRLKKVMENIYDNIKAAAIEYGSPGNFVIGANAAGFKRVSAAMIAQGI